MAVTPKDQMAELDGSHESAETETYFAAHGRAQQEPHRAEGMAQGFELGIQQGIEKSTQQGLAARRDLLCRQAARKFDARTAARLPQILAEIDDARSLAWAADLIIDCATGEELTVGIATGNPAVFRTFARLGINMAEMDRLHACGKLEDYVEARCEDYRDRYRAEGMAQGLELGIEQGIAQGAKQSLSEERDLLRRQAVRKFGWQTASTLECILADIVDVEGLARTGDAIIDCATGEELILCLRNAQVCA